MVKALLDTCVISELKRPTQHPNVIAWVSRLRPEETFISVISLGEIAKGVHLLPEGARRRDLWLWFSSFEQRFSQNVLAIDRRVAHVWGEVEARTKTKGFALASTDGLIAATAIHHGLYVVTRNVKHFEPTSVLVINPWDS